jgi:hypothetical protein
MEIRLIEGFPHIWETRIVWNTRKCYSTQVSCNSHNAHYFPCIAQLFCMPKTCIFITLTMYTLLHMNSNILRKMLY